MLGNQLAKKFTMAKRLLATFFLTTLLSVIYIYSQDSAYLRKNVLKIERQDSLSNTIYKAVSDYQLFMIGENHGTNEAARFVISLASLLIKNGNNVQIGLEMPSDWMTKYILSPTDSNIYSSEFFTRKSHDGRASFAWADIISNFNDNHSAEIFFYDGNKDEYKNFISSVNGLTYLNRDSLMYLKIKKQILLHPTWKTITLSGNVHNMLSPYDNTPTMACYLINDKSLDSASIKILSIVHRYENGTVLSDWGDGLKIHETDKLDSFLTRTADYENYLLLYPRNSASKYNGMYFTRKVTAATLVNEK
jgi:hypothetical protein